MIEQASALVEHVRHGDSASFGGLYEQLLDAAELDEITRELRGVLSRAVQDWLPLDCDPPTAIGLIHEQVARAYPNCLRLVAVNLVVLEHLARSSVGLSDFLADLDGSLALLYSALLLGSIEFTEQKHG